MTKETAIDILESQKNEHYKEEINEALDMAISALSADVRENIHGHWIEQIDHEENCRTLICSNCDRPALHDEDSIWKHKFCPHCGADMREPKGEKTKDGIQI
jgi:transcription initiation factor IIE alpha subunit